MTARRHLAWQGALFLGLALCAANLASVADAAIGIYQAKLSPAWGRPCAHLRTQGGESCSAHARRLIAERGAWAGMAASMKRFEACGRIGKEAP